MQEDDLIAKELNEFFKNDVSALNIKENSFITNMKSDDITDPIDEASDKYKFRASILLIEKHLENRDIFSFQIAEIGDIEKEINNINSKKAPTMQPAIASSKLTKETLEQDVKHVQR